ncbi:hypothetical protein FRACYDRAFT_155497, partial [Fragilariopsis cylindrus CCMP1102]
WEEVEDPSSGTVYYYNSETGESSWDRPTSAVDDNQDIPDPLPECWVETEDESSGKMYYFNSLTGETSWDRPKVE